MAEVICSACHGRGSDVTVKCTNCGGSGYDPEDDKPFAQCHTCYGEGTEDLDICPRCDGEGKIDAEDLDDESDLGDEDEN